MHADLLGKYRLVQHLASGGMANVYLARLSGLGGFERHVVLKTLRSEGLSDDTLVPMFLDEARLVATLHHPHIAQVYEVGREDSTYFLAMEYVHGETVRSVLETASGRGRALPLEFGLTVACAAAAGLHHAHERCDLDGVPLGIVHRDVTPSNVIVSFDGAIKLIDFGIAKAAVRTTVTRTGLIKGKVGYMAPEQVRGYAIDRRTDVFALGVLVYELTTQSRAFDAETQFEQLERSAHSELVPPTQIIAGYPKALEDVVMTALELDPDDRYPNADAMRAALVRVAGELGLSLGDACVVRVLESLYGRRPEPWLSGQAGFARGSGNHDAIVDDVDDDDAVTNPIELATHELLPFEPEPSRRAVTVPIATRPVAPAPPPVASAPVAPTPRPPLVIPSAPPPVLPRSSTVGAPLPRHARAAAHGWWRSVILGGAVVFALGCVAAIVVEIVTHERERAAPPAVVVAPARAPAPPVAPAPTPAPAPARLAPAPTPPPAPAPTPDHVTLNVVTEPPGATVVLDGVRLGTSPYLAEVPIKTGRAWLKVRKSNHIAVKIPVSLERDVTWTVRLRARR